MFFHLAAYALCFGVIWYAAGRVVQAVASLSKSWGLPAFTVSFFILGFMTSLPELAIGSMAVLEGNPRIFAGNLLGAMVVVFLLVIPLLSIVGNGVKFPVKQVSHKELFFILTVVTAPSFLAADQRITLWEAWFLIALYVAMAVTVSFRHTLHERVKQLSQRKTALSKSSLAAVGVSVLLLFLASRQIVDSTIFFAEKLELSSFLVSLILVALGTNIPELSIVFRSVLARRTDIALADYLGSASANTFLFGLLTILHGESFSLPGALVQRLIFMVICLSLFFAFARSKDTLSRREGSALILLYCAFLALEIWESGVAR